MASNKTPFGRKTAAIIIKRVAAGESLTRICEDSHIPNRSVVYRWLKERPSFRERYEAARSGVTSLMESPTHTRARALSADVSTPTKEKPAAPKRGKGRPALYCKELADLIIEMLLEGQSLRAVCSRGDMPSKSTVFRWINDNEQFRQEYERARQFQADLDIDAIRDIADDESIKDKVTLGKAKLRVESRFKLAEKLFPKRFGNKITQELTGVDGGPVELEDKSRPNDLEIARRVAFLLEKGMQDLKGKEK